MTIEQIELLTKEHAADRALLAERVQNLNEQMQQAKTRLLPGIKTAVGKAKDSRARLQSLIENSRTEFVSPKTRVFHGIRVGFKKGIGKLTFAATADEVVKLIRKHFAHKFKVLVKTKETPVKKALQQLPADQLKKIACEIGAAGDQVVLEAVDGEVDKLVAALLAEPADDVDDENSEAA